MSVPGAAGAWLGLFLVYLRCAAGTFYFEDSPELLACAATLGNSHDPGYPLWLLVSRLAMAVPVGCPAFRVNLLGAACAAGAAVLLGALATAALRAWGRPRPVALGAGLFVALVWAFSDTFWWQAGIGDKYPAFYLSFVALLWASWTACDRPEGGVPRRFLGASLLAGVALAHHPFILFALPAVLGGAFMGLRGSTRIMRLVAVGLAVFLLPVSTRVLYPPVRAVSDLDWGDPGTASRLVHYMAAARYRPDAVDPREPTATGTWGTGVRLFVRLLREDVPLPLLVGLPFGLTLAIARAPVWGLAALACVVLNLAFAVHTPVKVVRWYGPAWAVVVLLAGIGAGILAGWLRRPRAALAAAVGAAIMAGGWQAARGTARNDLSRFYAAHDYARNLLVSLPPDAVYLGRGDADLFTLWATRFVEGSRPDVEAVGMGSLVDRVPADVAGVRRLVSRFQMTTGGWEALRWLLGPPPLPGAFYAKTGYDRELWESLTLGLHRARGLVARLPGRWDPAGSLAETRRAARGYTWRGIRYARAGAVFDLGRPRDELARDALLHCAFCFSSLGSQFLVFDGPSRAAEAAWAFGVARRLAEPLLGPLPRPASGLPPFELAIAERMSLAAGCERLSDIFAAREVRPLAYSYLAAADSLRIRVAR